MKYWDRAWNPITGCTSCSDACEHCYARALLEKRKIAEPHLTFDLRINKKQLNKSFDRKSETIMVCSQGDLFHENIPDKIIDGILRKCFEANNKKFLILTKRSARMFNYFNNEHLIDRIKGNHYRFNFDNMAFGVSVESGKYIDRIEHLKACKHIKNRFIAFEPLLNNFGYIDYIDESINWVVVGCESGENARPCEPEWIESIIIGTKEKGIPCFVNNVNINGKITDYLADLPEIFHQNDRIFDDKK